jgi:phospholipid/cholesterol/gamma-HCH transport system permease protein
MTASTTANGDANSSEAAWVRFADVRGARVLQAGGDWTVFGVAALARKGGAPDRGRPVDAMDVSAVARLDTAGALELLRQAGAAGGGKECRVEGAGDAHRELLALVARNAVAPQKPRPHSFVAEFLEHVGESAIHFFEQIARLLGFFGEVLAILAGAIVRPRRFRLGAVVAQSYEVWIRALPIAGILTFLIGIVLAYQGVQQLSAFGAEAFTVDAVGISVLRELGVLLTAIIVAGRSGSAFTAQLGTMKVNLEIDAMQTMGLNPMEWLVVPRIIALTVTMPLLTFFANIMGLLGGAFACSIYLDFTVAVYFERMRDSVGIWHFWVGMIKAPVFAFVIAAVGCYEGMQVEGSAESVGKQTTKAVVEAIFFVIVLDAIFSVLFLMAGV